MSPAVEQIRKTVEDRIRELGPVIAELEQLQSILSLLENSDHRGNGNGASTEDMAALLAQVGLESGPAAAAPAPIRRSRRGTKPGRDGRAPQGANKQRIIEAVLDDPGVTATEISERTGVKRTVVSATINRLKRNGELEADGQGVRVPVAREPVAVG
ncbi:MAG TPA: winged helix-turn-helix domain-containing protein [Solirubrobacterales bacterium]